MIKPSIGVKHYLLVVLLLLSTGSFAFELSLVSPEGKPIANAFVAIVESADSDTLVESAFESVPDSTVAVMDQVDVQFVPKVLAVDVGQSVVFPNSDSIRHHVYSFSKPKQFEIKLYDGVPLSPVLFDAPGIVVLGCNIHDAMQGYIVVSPWSEYGLTGADGKLALSSTPLKLALWHADMPTHTQFQIVPLDSNNTSSATITLNITSSATKTKTFPAESWPSRRQYDD